MSQAITRKASLCSPAIIAVVLVALLAGLIWQISAGADLDQWTRERESSRGPQPPTSGDLNDPRPAAPFVTLPLGAPLPSEEECARMVRQQGRSSFELHPENHAANQTNVYREGHRFPAHDLDGYGARVTGNFTGTTDEIFQWAACKWGFDVDTVRAQAVQESEWNQALLGDCHPRQATQPDTRHCASMGIMQVKGANIPPDHPYTYPHAMRSTAFNVDYTLATRRHCYAGKVDWLHDADVRSENGRPYGPGDEWGCMGLWFSGRWYDSGAVRYLYQRSNLGNGIQYYYQQKPWLLRASGDGAPALSAKAVGAAGGVLCRFGIVLPQPAGAECAQ
jgi:hypothetical protein